MSRYINRQVFYAQYSTPSALEGAAWQCGRPRIQTDWLFRDLMYCAAYNRHNNICTPSSSSSSHSSWWRWWLKGICYCVGPVDTARHVRLLLLHSLLLRMWVGLTLHSICLSGMVIITVYIYTLRSTIKHGTYIGLVVSPLYITIGAGDRNMSPFPLL